GSADGRRAWTLCPPNGDRPSARAHGRVAAARHRPCAVARRDAALVTGHKPILVPGRAGASHNPGDEPGPPAASRERPGAGGHAILDLGARVAYRAPSPAGE